MPRIAADGIIINKSHDVVNESAPSVSPPDPQRAFKGRGERLLRLAFPPAGGQGNAEVAEVLAENVLHDEDARETWQYDCGKKKEKAEDQTRRIGCAQQPFSQHAKQNVMMIEIINVGQ